MIYRIIKFDPLLFCYSESLRRCDIFFPFKVVLNNDETDLMEVLVTARNEEKNAQTFNWRKLIDGIGRNRYRAFLRHFAPGRVIPVLMWIMN